MTDYSTQIIYIFYNARRVALVIRSKYKSFLKGIIYIRQQQIFICNSYLINTMTETLFWTR